LSEHKGLFHPPRDMRLFVLLGAFGSGKTEIAINLALALAAQGRQAALADLDLVNPYFRSQEKDSLLEARGVRVIAPQGDLRHADLPSVPARLWQLIYNKELHGVLDIGGDMAGARVLGAYQEDLKKQDSATWYVFNRSRYDNQDSEKALFNLRQIEAHSGLRVSGILHNTHLIGDTTAQTVREGARDAEGFARQAGLSLICHCVREDLVPQLAGLTPLFPLKMHMLRPWEDESFTRQSNTDKRSRQ